MTNSYAIGVDLGGTKTEVVLCIHNDGGGNYGGGDYGGSVSNRDGSNYGGSVSNRDVGNHDRNHDNSITVKERIRVKTPSDNYDKIVNTIVDLITCVSKQLPNGLEDVKRIGVGTPGTEYGAKKLITNSNTKSLQDRPLRRDIQHKIGREITIENDANCFALAEAVLGAGTTYNTIFGVIMGTGVGGGIIIDKKIHKGRTGMSGEWGHHTLHTRGNLCYCGRRGCVETYISGPALERRWMELTRNKMNMPQIISHIVTKQNIGGGSSGNNNNNSSRNNKTEQNGERMWHQEALENFGHALANVINIIDPDAIILGGGLSNIPMWYDEGVKSVREKIFSHVASDIPILKNRLGDSAGVIGACLI